MIAATFRRFGDGWVDPFDRCSLCPDPCRKGWTLCDRCHAFVHPDTRAAKAYVARLRQREARHATGRALRHLTRRLQIVENALSWRLLETSACDADWQTR
jgi:hypothetical protein